MPFHVIPGDITEFNGDAIVNSLGTNTKRYGKICRNVMEGINDENIKKYIDSLGELKPLTIVGTKQGHLPCKKVIHVVTPYKKDDPDNKKLLQCYRNAIDYAINLGLKSIAIPLIGTGTNGYSKYDSSEALNKASSEIIAKEDQSGISIIDICEYLYIGKKNYSEDRYRCRELGYENEQYLVLYDCCKTFSRVHLNESFQIDINEFYASKKYRNRNPYYFYLFLLEKKGLNELEILNPNCSKVDRHSLSKVMHLTNKDIIQLSVLAKFNRTEVLELMSYNGSCFSPRSILDMTFLKCIKHWYDIKSYEDLIEMVYEESLIYISFTKLKNQFLEMDHAWTTDAERKKLHDYLFENKMF